MLVLPERAGPADPMGSSPGRRDGSARRTTNIDTSRPNGPQENSVVDARARDLVTGPSGEATYLCDQNIQAQIAPNRELIAVESDPPEPRLAQRREREAVERPAREIGRDRAREDDPGAEQPVDGEECIRQRHPAHDRAGHVAFVPLVA